MEPDQASVPAPPFRVSHPDLSIWQSAVHEVVADHVAAGDLRARDVGSHPLVVRADADVRACAREGRSPDRESRLGAIFELAERSHLGLLSRAASFLTHARAYSDEDPQFVVECIGKFIEWYALRRAPMYRDWRVDGRGDIRFGVVDYRLPATARVGIIADWGTGQDDARDLLARLLRDCRPDVLVHLGDVYYAGTPREARYNFAATLEEALAGRTRIPVFNLAGNHDYYSGGRGFYWLLDQLNDGGARQQASYVCLRSQDLHWQLVGVDTGRNDRVPATPFDSGYKAPTLQASEAEWLDDKLSRFGGRTVLLSHHQPFSAHTPLNGPSSGARRPNFNDALLDLVRPHRERLAAWLWGHEHTLAVFQDGLEGIGHGRLLGCSAFEVRADEDPYTIRFPDAPYRSPLVQLSVVNGWYAHGFAVVDLGGPAIEYYECAPWATRSPDEPLRPMFTESLSG